jgi:hypothetical protein
MTSCHRRTVALALSAALVALWTIPAFGERFEAAYSAPPGCPARADFVAAVEARIPGWRHTERDGERTIEAQVEKSVAGFAGTIAIDGGRNRRDVEGPRCDSVVRALALIAAVALDPERALSEMSGEEDPSPPVGAATPPARVPSAPAKPAPATPSLAFGVGAPLLFGPAPKLLYGIEAHAELGSAARAFLVRAAAARLTTGSVDFGSGSAHFQLTYGELAGCYRPVRRTIVVLGCLVVDAGRMEAAGEPGGLLAQVKTSERFWGAAGARLGLGVPVVPPLELGARAGLLLPWRSQSYIFENPEENLFDSAPIAVDFALTATVVLPSGG